ncbi:DUF547 domain-containing protein [Adhaeribacter pallidiroseus]|uniref:DUF547 domain-containing protein n=1 Tax=Adhaeribacter pallidiroseus TaxID=2072847 RepID=A0A369QTE8_9BACT|nr:DUF547 domain-containing protein [Adhaeribacter pallidiroseus]RDC65438.1 hypothetical protein AHMF7616_04068 [Adhaeribacter pallidiroseus]
MSKVALFVFLIFAGFNLSAQNTLPTFTAEADAFLKKFVVAGKVDYAAVKKEAKSIQSLSDKIGSIDLAEASDNSKKAFYINAYNLLVIQAVTNGYPLQTVMDKPGFFDKTLHLVAGEKLTLNNLEKKKLLEPYRDARLHFVLVCAALSCPPLADFAYTPDQMDTQLNTRTQLALNNPTFIRVNTPKQQVLISKIFDWYQADFLKNNQTVLHFINAYRSNKIPENYQLGFYEYDWNLNKK